MMFNALDGTYQQLDEVLGVASCMRGRVMYDVQCTRRYFSPA